MTRGPYEPERARQLRILLWVVVVIAVGLLGWAALIVLGDGSASTALRVLALPALLLGALAAGALRALNAEDERARLLSASAGVVAVVVAILLSRTVAGLLVAVIGVPLLLIALLPGREVEP